MSEAIKKIEFLIATGDYDRLGASIDAKLGMGSVEQQFLELLLTALSDQVDAARELADVRARKQKNYRQQLKSLLRAHKLLKLEHKALVEKYLNRVSELPVAYFKDGGVTHAVYGSSSIAYVEELLDRQLTPEQLQVMDDVREGSI